MPFAGVVAYFVKGQHARVESQNKQEQCSLDGTQIQQCSQSQVEYIHHVQV